MALRHNILNDLQLQCPQFDLPFIIAARRYWYGSTSMKPDPFYSIILFFLLYQNTGLVEQAQSLGLVSCLKEPIPTRVSTQS